MEQNVEKHEYETPSLTVHGSIETITQGASGTTALDAAFPAHTPVGGESLQAFVWCKSFSQNRCALL
ncbi:lasso RiPP family leader peptide-containing protein, partial [bacterium M00.F.Ca.ET.168.01.1.1]